MGRVAAVKVSRLFPANRDLAKPARRPGAADGLLGRRAGGGVTARGAGGGRALALRPRRGPGALHARGQATVLPSILY